MSPCGIYTCSWQTTFPRSQAFNYWKVIRREQGYPVCSCWQTWKVVLNSHSPFHEKLYVNPTLYPVTRPYACTTPAFYFPAFLSLWSADPHSFVLNVATLPVLLSVLYSVCLKKVPRDRNVAEWWLLCAQKTVKHSLMRISSLIIPFHERNTCLWSLTSWKSSASHVPHWQIMLAQF